MRRCLLLLACGAAALPASAEGGHMYPSEGVIAFGLFAFGLGIPAVLAGLAGGLLRWLRPAARRSGWLIFGAAWLTWAAGMLALASGFTGGLRDEYAITLTGALSFGAALLAAWRPGRSKPAGSGARPSRDSPVVASEKHD